MNWKNTIAALAMVGMVGIAAEAYAGGACCPSGKTKMTQAGGSSGSCGSMQKSADKGGSCGTMAKGSGACTGTASMHCDMSPAECEQMLRAYYQDHGWLGADLICEDGTICQPKITKVAAGSPAEAAGFRAGDLVVSMNGIKYSKETEASIHETIEKGFRVGDTVTYTVTRDGKSATLQATLVRIPDAALKELIASHAGAHKSAAAGDKAENVR